MNQLIQGESSSGPLVHLEKRGRGRGRPRKDPTLKSPRALLADTESVIGQPVTGFIESSFDAGYLLTVRIGNSSTNLSGVVFKPGHLAPITSENDVAPHLQMIRRKDFYSPAERGGSRYCRPKLGIIKGSAKRRNATPQVGDSLSPFGSRGNVVPVVLQPVDLLNKVPPTSSYLPPDPSRTPQLLEFGDKDVHHVEPLSIIPPDQAISQRFLGSVPQQNTGMQFREKTEPSDSTDSDDLISSETWEDEWKSSEVNEDSSPETKPVTGNADAIFSTLPAPLTTSFTESLQNGPFANPLFSYGAGRMTELLQAVQENIKDKQMQIPEQQIPSSSNVEFNGLGTTASHSNC